MKRNARILTVILLFGSAAVALWAQSFDDLTSPYAMASGPGVSTIQPGSAEALNPAIPGGIQRTTLSASYLGLFGSPSGAGNAANLGAAFPYPFGVISAGARFISSAVTGYNYGTLAGARLSFAKDLYPDFYVGAGINSLFGPNWGLWGTVGFLYLPGDVAFMKNVTVGLSLDNLGRIYTPDGNGGGTAGFAFTPRLSADATLLASGPVTVDSSLYFDTPAFSDLNAGIGVGVTLFDTVRLSGSYKFQLNPTLNNTASTYPFGFGVDVHLNLAGGSTASASSAGTSALGSADAWRNSEINIRTAAAPLSNNVWAAGGGAQIALGVIDRTPPEVQMTAPDTTYISPNYDGVQDSLVLPISIHDQRYVKGYRLTITDSSGKVVRTIENKENRPENAAVGTIISRLLYVKTGIPIPATITWDGVGNSGSVVPDGRYTYKLEAWDDNGNIGRTDPKSVVVDTVAPDAKVAVPFTIFAPGGESTHATLPVSQSGSGEDKWTGSILDSSGKPIRTYTWQNAEPPSFAWDGRNQSGETVPNGVYSYRLASTDRAGNVGSFTIPNITVLTVPTPLALTVNTPAFSPNGDGVKDTVTLSVDAKRTVPVSHWELGVYDAYGTKVRTYSGTSDLPTQVLFDGKGENGSVLPEGEYKGKLAVLYINGNAPEASSTAFALDLTPPSATVTAEYPVFSPDGDGRKDTVAFDQVSSREIGWDGTVKNGAGQVVRSVHFIGTADPLFTWNGTDNQGRLVPDGTYSYTLHTVDLAGNSGSSKPVTVVIDTRPTSLTLSANPLSISPNGDGVQDTTVITPDAGLNSAMDSWNISIHNSSGAVVRSYSGTQALPPTLIWNGADTAGSTVPDGTYSITARLSYRKGNLVEMTGPSIVVDTVAPSVSVTTDVPVFSPDGDGYRDTILLKQTSSTEDLWQGKISNSSGNVIRTFSWKGKVQDLVWDGRDAAGNVVPDGLYSYSVSATDRAGNSGSAELPEIRVDTRPTPVSLKVDTSAFSPNGDGVLDVLHFSPLLKVNSGIATWSLAVNSAAGEAVRRWTGTGSVPAVIPWDGKTDGGGVAAEGRYVGVLSVVYEKGNRETAKTGDLLLDVTPPSATVTASPSIFSPNGDGRQDTVRIVQSGSTEVAWSGKITDAAGKTVRTYSFGQKPDPSIMWDGRSDSGVLLPNGTYVYRLSATDEAGNVGTSNPVSIVLEVRDTPVSISRTPGAFSPNGDGVKDSVTISPKLAVTDGVDAYEVRIVAGTQTVRTYRGTGAPAPIVWDGRSDSGATAPDGDYRALLTVDYTNGNRSTAQSPLIVLDTQAPTAVISAGYTLFSPNGDGLKDTVPISQSTSSETRWSGTVTDANNAVVRSYEWPGAAPDFAWDGKDNNGNLVPDGSYTYTLAATDDAGNSTTSSISGITVDTRPTPVFVSADQAGFSPNG
ncbi:MAG TPA: FlgD immunoglobulin-like domain containing protein, partial [Spirochaetia bacterium]|nr:FlgD immunoglobulin-like domain containing protein [Spirochaetia bacterium]